MGHSSRLKETKEVRKRREGRKKEEIQDKGSWAAVLEDIIWVIREAEYTLYIRYISVSKLELLNALLQEYGLVFRA
jgi:hypothetical protein